jgi:hypothetical protein
MLAFRDTFVRCKKDLPFHLFPPSIMRHLPCMSVAVSFLTATCRMTLAYLFASSLGCVNIPRSEVYGHPHSFNQIGNVPSHVPEKQRGVFPPDILVAGDTRGCHTTLGGASLDVADDVL